jgi:hypothetical protein
MASIKILMSESEAGWRYEVPTKVAQAVGDLLKAEAIEPTWTMGPSAIHKAASDPESGTTLFKDGVPPSPKPQPVDPPTEFKRVNRKRK